MQHFPDLRAALATCSWAVVGGAATRLYMPERKTNDLDIIIAADSASDVAKLLVDEGLEKIGELSTGGTTWRMQDGYTVDVLESGERWIPSALTTAASNLDGQGFPVLPLEYLVLLKMRASRAIDVADVSKMLGLADDDSLAKVRSSFTKWAPEDIEDLESLILLGRLEYGA